MPDRIVTSRSMLRFDDGELRPAEDAIVTEQPVTIVLNEEEFATLVCSPEHIADMAVGFMASEGVISSYAELSSLSYDDKSGFIYAETTRPTAYAADFHSKRYVGSCCGKSRQGFYFWSDARTTRQVESRQVRLTPDDCFRLMDDMQRGADTFRSTGGVHNAALCDETGVVLMRSDIGRHNALDKIYGYALRTGLDCSGKIIAFSGRISSEILLKTAKIGCEVVLSKSAPTELALELADQLGLTTVGFIRGHSLNVYTHPERIIASKPDANPEIAACSD